MNTSAPGAAHTVEASGATAVHPAADAAAPRRDAVPRDLVLLSLPSLVASLLDFGSAPAAGHETAQRGVHMRLTPAGGHLSAAWNVAPT